MNRWTTTTVPVNLAETTVKVTGPTQGMWTLKVSVGEHDIAFIGSMEQLRRLCREGGDELIIADANWQMDERTRLQAEEDAAFSAADRGAHLNPGEPF